MKAQSATEFDTFYRIVALSGNGNHYAFYYYKEQGRMQSNIGNGDVNERERKFIVDTLNRKFKLKLA